MRLIDADALKLCVQLEIDEVKKIKASASVLVILNRFIDSINAQPPIEERKTGKWIISNTNSKVTTYKCSECGRIVHDDTGYDVSKDYPYCHCGSDMRGELK